MSARERTELLVAKILSRLAENVTTKMTLVLSTFDPGGLLKIDKLEFLDALDWLESEGLIRCGAGWIGLVGHDRCVLTSYGFSILGQSFGGEGNVQTVGDAAAKIDKENKVDQSKVGDFLGGLFGGFTKSILS